MDYKELIENHDFSSPAKVADWIWNATCAITDLLARAEAAEARAEKAERERDEVVEVICTHCRVLPCRGNECYWYRSQKEE